MKIVTIVPYKWHLNKKFFNKDIIQIWRTFISEKNYDSEFWTIEKKWNKNFSYKNQQRLWFKNFLAICKHLINDWKNINVLHLYHIWRYPFILWLIYKIINKNWLIYLKTDLAYKNINWKKVLSLNKYLLKTFFSIFTYIWIEDKFLLKEFTKKLPDYKNKFFFLPSWAVYNENYDWKLDKKNIISLCWRFWDDIKNYELMIKALEENEIHFLKNWKIYFIWDSTSSFRKKIKELLIKKPELENIIKIVWFIQEKDELYKYLSISKIFIHTAKSEWEPNVQFDAMFCWCYMISSDVWTIKMNYPKKYSDFYESNNSKKLFEKLKNVIENIDNLKNEDFLKIQKKCINNYIWKKSLSSLLDQIK